MDDPPWSPDDLRLTDPDAYSGDRPIRKPFIDGAPLRGGTDSHAAFDFSTPAYPPASSPGSELPARPYSSSPVTPFDTPVAASTPAGSRPKSVKRARLSWTALTVVIAGTLLGALLLYQAIASISLISKDPLGDGLLWLTGWVAMDIVVTVGLILGAIALVRGPRRGLAGLAIALGVLVTPLVFLGAVQLGADVVQERARLQLAHAGGAAGTSVVAYADQHDIDLGPFRPILEALLDDGR